MNPIPELTPALKQLRLSGISNSLAARNRRAIDGKLAYTEFLALLIQDFESLPGVNRHQIADLAAGHYLDEKAPVLIVGPCGTGKSHLAQALGHCALRQGHEVLFTSQGQLCASLNAARAIGGFERG